MALDAGTTLGPYEVVGLIGQGGMGEVYQARDTRLDRTVAIKVLPEHVASGPDLKQRFEPRRRRSPACTTRTFARSMTWASTRALSPPVGRVEGPDAASKRP